MIEPTEPSAAPEPTTLADARLLSIERRLAKLHRAIPGAWTIAAGVFLGMLAYSVVGVICTALLWTVIVGAMGHALARETATSSPPQPPAHQP